MRPLRRFLDNIEPLFVKGGRFERFHAIYEMVDTLFYSPPDVTRSSPHIRESIDLKPLRVAPADGGLHALGESFQICGVALLLVVDQRGFHDDLSNDDLVPQNRQRDDFQMNLGKPEGILRVRPAGVSDHHPSKRTAAVERRDVHFLKVPQGTRSPLQNPPRFRPLEPTPRKTGVSQAFSTGCAASSPTRASASGEAGYRKGATGDTLPLQNRPTFRPLEPTPRKIGVSQAFSTSCAASSPTRASASGEAGYREA